MNKPTSGIAHFPPLDGGFLARRPTPPAPRALAWALLACFGAASCGGTEPGPEQTPVAVAATTATTTCPAGQFYYCPPPTPDVKHPPCGCFTSDSNYTIVPHYYLAGVVYAPPGKSSSVSYSSSTTLGSTVSATSSFTHDTKVTASGGVKFPLGGMDSTMAGLDITSGTAFGNTRTDATDVAETFSSGFKMNGQSDGIDHNYDQIILILKPVINVTVSGASGAVLWKFASTQGTSNYIVQPLYAGWLNNSMPMPSNIKANLDWAGITTTDYGKILAADPLFFGLPPGQGMDPARFDYIGAWGYQPLYAPGNTSNMNTYALNQSTTSSTTTTSSNTISTGFTVSAGANIGILNAKLSVANTWTWTNSSSQKESTGTGSMDQFVIGQAPNGYTGPTVIHVYEDRIYKTYAFTLDPPQGYATDLALGRPAAQSTEYPYISAPATRATDGNTDGNFYDGSVSLTNYGWTYESAGSPGQYWFVDLGAEHLIDSVNIANRTDCCSEMLSHYNILAWSSATSEWMVVSDHSQTDTTGELFITQPMGMVKTQYVMIGKTDPNYLSLAEVQVMGW